MEWLRVWPFFGLVVFTAAQNSTNSHPHRSSYLLLVPKVLRPEVRTQLSVTVLTSRPLTVQAHILHGNSSVASNSTRVGGDRSNIALCSQPQNRLSRPRLQVLASELSYWRPYQLLVSGYDGNTVTFTNSTRLRFSPKCLSTFIQTDKNNYKAGQEVKIRAVSVHPDGKPHKEPVDIIIKDSRGNMVRQWFSVDGVLGVVSKTLQLSENPPLGKWTIVTTVSGVVSQKHFTVAHYVLPKFEVLIDAPAVVYHEDSLGGFVTARYMYGKPVQGHVNITYFHHFHGIEVAYDDGKEIDGTADFMFDVPNYQEMSIQSEDYLYYESYSNEEFLTIVVHVTEYLTGVTHNSTATVSLAKRRYRLEFDGYPAVLKPSVNFTAELKIFTYDGHPLTADDQGKMATVIVMQRKRSVWSWRWDESGGLLPRMGNMSEPYSTTAPKEEQMLVQEMLLPVPADGVIPIFIQLYDEIESLIIDASFEDGEQTLQLYNSYSSPSQSYLQIQTPQHPPQVKSRGQIVSAGKGSAPLALVPEESWAPLACIIVYCVQPGGEVVNDALQLHITQALKNQVSLKWSEERVRPADKVSLSVSVAEPGSLVGILVVDKAARGSKPHNDITTETVLEEMEQYSFDKADLSPAGMRTGDPYSIFTMCGLEVLTDANLHMMDNRPRPELPGEGIHVFDQDYGSYMEDGREPRERRSFPETWLWLESHTGDSTTAEMTLTVPDSITTWTATAFVMSQNLGLGILETPVELIVYQDFFLSLNLPAYIIRGEELVLEVSLFNYLPHDLEVMVIVAESETFEFVFPDNEELSMASVRRLSVGRDSGASVLVPIKPLVLGEIPVSVKAISSVASDAIRKMVLVKPEGLEQSFSTSLLLEFAASERTLSREITFTFPADVVEGSERAKVTAVGDILGPSITGLDSLIQMPYGCGEQNMIHFAPNIYVLQYLGASGQTDQALVDKATSYMLKGYERELAYQRADGSFSAFGDSDSSGSTWLTAFVLRCFLQARPFISIDPLVLQRAAAWLGSQQGVDGRFLEPGRVIHTELQGGLDGPVALTAYVLMALLEDDTLKGGYASRVSAALLYLETRLALGVSSNYSLALLCYALSLSDSSSSNQSLNQLLGRAEMRDGVPFWSSPHVGLSASWQPRTTDIEMAAYLLLSLQQGDRTEEGLALMKWLSQQRNHLGGYGSTQDTVVALQALSTFAASSGSDDLNLTIRVNTGPSDTVASFHIDHTNHLLHQSQRIDAEEELTLQVTAEGQGFALFQLNVFYNTEGRGLSRRRRDVGEQEAFILDVELFDSEMYPAHLYICTRLSGERGLNETGMAIMEVGLLSGFSLAQDGIRTGSVVRRIETTPGKVILYLDSVTTSEMCVRVPLTLEYKVAKVQHAAVVIYDYYEPRRRTVRTYTSERRHDMTSCSFCGHGCSECRPPHQPTLADHANQNAATLRLLCALLVLCVLRL
ncbi:CD109 antigen [Lampris incognitus]|uniref:CD109 antigen n=1 Tax=Lampris incognitus TaxID=2546036 RepID=UPI0024B615F3|nr:CD109 antigen [Lampris incognitus]